MNPFQRARDEALKTRERLCPGKVDDQVSARELLTKVEEVFNLAVLPVAPSYPELGGGSAVLKRNQEVIYVSTEFPEWGDEFCGLVAHEIGHWLLDPIQAETTIADIKTLLGGEGSPAVIKVEAYGARERQELQANVFARELLLPRRLARASAYSGKGPQTVAVELGIPLELVRQQVLDALLVPESSVSEISLKPASTDQDKAARAVEQFANVVAGPGTGKTSTLIHRIKYLAQEKGVDPSQILVLTFTNKAAIELVERLRNAGIVRASDIWAGTFHAFGLEFLRKYHQHFGLEAELNVADKMASVAALIRELPHLELKYYLRVQDPYDWLGTVVSGITRLKEELVDPATYRDHIFKHPDEDAELQRRREDIAVLYEAHEGALAKREVVDFVDLIAKPALAIAADRVPFSELIDRFQYILVDEYQDVTHAMVELLRQLAHKKSLWVVGDVRQAIHHWRGASLKSLLKFDSEFKAHAGGGKIGKYPLEFNRRSNSEILDLVQKVGRTHMLQENLPLDPMTATNGPCGVKPYLVTCDKRIDLVLAIERGILKSVEEGRSFGKQAILCRNGREVRQTAEHLMKQGLPVLYIGELADQPGVKVLLCLMQLLVERQPRALVGLTSVPSLAMSIEDIQLLIDAADENTMYQRGRWISAPPPGLSSQGEQVRESLMKLIGSFTHRSNPWSFVCDLLLEHRLCLPDESDQSVPAWVRRMALWQFAYAVRSGDGDMKEAQLTRFLLRQRLRQRIGDAYVDRGLPPEAASLDGIRLETVHGSKGLEFDVVHVGFVSAGSYSSQLPNWHPIENVLDIVPPGVLGSSLEEHQFEESVERNNLMYVAVSRARERLFLYQEVEYGGNDLAPQLLYCESLVKTFKFADQNQEEAITTAVKSFTAPATLSFEHFDLYSMCPLHYWYAHVLKLSREQEADVWVRARWAIMAAIKEVAKDDEHPDSALDIEWHRATLPSDAADPSLWRDARFAYYRGVQLIGKLRAAGGSFSELTSVVAGLNVELPWGFVVATPYTTKLHLVRFNRSRISDVQTLLKPVIAGLDVKGTRTVELHHVMSDHVVEAQTARRVEQTKGYKAAVRFLAGNNRPTKGHHCTRCSYMTMCPASPAI